MKWASAISREIDIEAAVRECSLSLAKQLGGERPDIAFVFASPHHHLAFDQLLDDLNLQIEAKHLVGCSGGGVIGAGREVEDQPGLSITAAVLPGVNIKVCHVDDDVIPGPDQSPRAWEEMAEVKASDEPEFVVLASPFMGKSDELLAGLDYAFPRSRKIGGMVSGLRGLGERALFWNHQRLAEGALLLSLSGDIRLETLVAQGCKPMGPLFTVTKVEGNMLLELDHQPALLALNKVFEEASPSDKRLINRALFVGLLQDPLLPWPPRHGDFVIRNVIGVDSGNKALALAAEPRSGQTMRFHVRDAGAAAEDLKEILKAREDANGEPAGALLFSCMGRGQGMYGRPHHDSEAFQERFGPVPLGGFFCNGEIGPVGSSTYIHGFTSSFGIFRKKFEN